MLAKLTALAVKDKAHRVFGASGHRYRLAPKLSEREVASVERQFGVTLPDDYRTFLLELGAGGLPAMSRRFPHTKKWNIRYPKAQPRDPDELCWQKRDAWNDAVYWSPKHTTGAICICHEGCAIRDWLVVTGKGRGGIWLDERVDDRGLLPRHVTFDEGTSRGCRKPRGRPVRCRGASSETEHPAEHRSPGDGGLRRAEQEARLHVAARHEESADRHLQTCEQADRVCARFERDTIARKEDDA